MARSVADAPLTTRAARGRLAVRAVPYWRGIEGGAGVGYRKGKRGGVWLVRVLDETVAGDYRQATLGRADDALPADGTTIMDWSQADKAARAWILRFHRVASGQEAAPLPPSAPYTVADAIRDYLADLERRGSRGLAQTLTSAEAHILPSFATQPVGRLNRDKLRDWHAALAGAAPRRRLKAGVARARITLAEHDEEAIRRRRATANRILTILKAALNHARTEGRATCPGDAWQLVKPFKGADAPKVSYLSDAEIVRLVNACPPDFRELVTGAILTGCRYGELAAMRARDLNLTAGTVTIPRSKSGKARHVVLTPEAARFFAGLADVAQNGPLFQRDATAKQASREAPRETVRAPWGQSDQFRPMRTACEAAGITPTVSFHVLRHTHASRLATRGVPMAVIAAQLGHSDTRMTERHYAHLAPSYVADTVRQAFGSMGLSPITAAAEAVASQAMGLIPRAAEGVRAMSGAPGGPEAAEVV